MHDVEKNCDFRPKSTFISETSETVRDMPMAAMGR